MAKVFLSWSGESSHVVAQALHAWLPVMLQSVSVFMSSEDLRKGGRWHADLAGELQLTNFGVICLTRSNLEAPWILFEAGALSKVVSESHVAPLLMGVKPSDLPGPLTQFNATGSDKEDFWKLLKAINSSSEKEAVKDELLSRSFEACWPSLKSELDKAIVSQDVRPANEADENPVEKFDAILQELRVLTRSQSQILSSPQQLFPLDQILETVDRHRRQNGLPEKNHPVWRDIARKFEDLKEIIRLVPPSPECMLLHSLASELEDALNYVLRRIESSVRIRRVEENPTLKRIDALGRRVEINLPSRRRPSIAERLSELRQTDAAQGRSEALAEEVDPQK